MKKKIATMLELIRIMESNTFLLKDSFSEQVELLSSKYGYRTYVGERGDDKRYIHIDLYEHGEEVVKIQFRKQKMQIVKDVDYNFSINDCVKIVQEIYNEIHSFKNHNEGARKIKIQISNCKKNIRSNQVEIIKLQKELEDCLLLN